MLLWLCFSWNLVHMAAEERTPSNPIAEDDQACKELYDLTFDIVAQKAPDIKGFAIPEPSQPSTVT